MTQIHGFRDLGPFERRQVGLVLKGVLLLCGVGLVSLGYTLLSSRAEGISIEVESSRAQLEAQIHHLTQFIKAREEIMEATWKHETEPGNPNSKINVRAFGNTPSEFQQNYNYLFKNFGPNCPQN